MASPNVFGNLPSEFGAIACTMSSKVIISAGFCSMQRLTISLTWNIKDTDTYHIPTYNESKIKSEPVEYSILNLKLLQPCNFFVKFIKDHLTSGQRFRKCHYADRRWFKKAPKLPYVIVKQSPIELLIFFRYLKTSNSGSNRSNRYQCLLNIQQERFFQKGKL